MAQSKSETADRRSPTDASLGAERATPDAENPVSAAGARRLLDELIERDRVLADSRPFKLRHRADRAHSPERSDSPSPSTAASSDIAATALEEARSALAQAQTQQHEVLGIVAHDLRSPLTVISMNAESIAETTHEAVTRTSARTITLAVARMERLLSDLIDVARIESGALRIIKRPHDLGSLLSEVAHSYEPMFSDRNITFAVNTPADSIVACFDYHRILQVLSNLLGNAMKFTQDEGTVVLHAERQVEQVVFALRDNGPGIPQSALPHIFKRFWQVDSEARCGLGLGLHICENIIQAHGGKIWAESDIGKGSTFRFALPLR